MIVMKEEARALVEQREKLLAMIADSYRRMATNTSMIYRRQQMAKCDAWLKELTEINQVSPIIFNTTLEQLGL